MLLSTRDTLALLRFCLGPDDSGLAASADDGTCRITIVFSLSSHEVHRFEAPTYLEALNNAAAAGVLNPTCVRKQLAFLGSREQPVPPALDVEPSSSATVVRAELFVELMRAIGSLLHETQRERGFSTVLVGRPDRDAASMVATQWMRTDVPRMALAALSAPGGTEVPTGVTRRLRRIESLMAAIGLVRGSVDAQAATPRHVIDVYSSMNAELLAALEVCLVSLVDPARRAEALACLALMHAKEKTGIERARLVAALLGGGPTVADRLAIAGLVAARTSSLQMFSIAAPSSVAQLLKRKLGTPAAIEVRRIEALVCSPDGAPDISADAWFDAVTRKIDMLHEVSDAALELFAQA
jgi:methyl-accepting chemotaxis protein